MKSVVLITDGSCLGNPGRGGWAAILRFNAHKKELWGSEPETTNNRMELQAVIAGLENLGEPCRILIEIDSQYGPGGGARLQNGQGMPTFAQCGIDVGPARPYGQPLHGFPRHHGLMNRVPPRNWIQPVRIVCHDSHYIWQRHRHAIQIQIQKA